MVIERPTHPRALLHAAWLEEVFIAEYMAEEPMPFEVFADHWSDSTRAELVAMADQYAASRASRERAIEYHQNRPWHVRLKHWYWYHIKVWFSLIWWEIKLRIQGK